MCHKVCKRPITKAKLVIVRHVKDKRYMIVAKEQGMFSILGGHIEQVDNCCLYNTLIRELREETNTPWLKLDAEKFLKNEYVPAVVYTSYGENSVIWIVRMDSFDINYHNANIHKHRRSEQKELREVDYLRELDIDDGTILGESNTYVGRMVRSIRKHILNYT